MNQEDTFYEIIRVGIAAVLIPLVIALMFHFTPLSCKRDPYRRELQRRRRRYHHHRRHGPIWPASVLGRRRGDLEDDRALRVPFRRDI